MHQLTDRRPLPMLYPTTMNGSPTNIKRPSIAFVMNIKTLSVDSFELANGHILRRATEVEINAIQRFCHSENIHSLWEYPLPNGGDLLPKKDWRYFVIDFPGNDDVLRDLRVAFDLSSKELEIGFWFMGTGALFHPERFRCVAGGGKIGRASCRER